MSRHQQTLHFSLNPRAREPLRMILGLGSTKQPLPSALVMGVMSTEAWCTVYVHSLYKRHNKVNHAGYVNSTSPKGSGKKHPELCCRIGAVVE